MKRIIQILWIGFFVAWIGGCGTDPKTEIPDETVPLTGEPQTGTGTLGDAGGIKLEPSATSR